MLKCLLAYIQSILVCAGFDLNEFQVTLDNLNMKELFCDLIKKNRKTNCRQDMSRNSFFTKKLVHFIM